MSSYFFFNESLYAFLCEANGCVSRQPDRQYYVKHDNQGNSIQYLLLKDDPCFVMNRPSQRQYWNLYDGSTLVAHIDQEILGRFLKIADKPEIDERGERK